MGRAWHQGEAAGGRVELGTRICFLGMLRITKNLFKDPTDYSYDGRDMRIYHLLIRVRAVAYDPLVTCEQIIK